MTSDNVGGIPVTWFAAMRSHGRTADAVCELLAVGLVIVMFSVLFTLLLIWPS